MIQITFNDSELVNPDRYGMDVIFCYQVEGQENRKIHAVSSTPRHKLNSLQEKEHTKVIFAGVLEYIKEYYTKYKELPPDGIIVQEQIDFHILKSEKIEWMGYSFNLS